MSLLYQFVLTYNIHIAQYLLDKKANINIGFYGMNNGTLIYTTPLECAMQYGYTEIVALLRLQPGA